MKYLWALPVAISLFALSWLVDGPLGVTMKIAGVSSLAILAVVLVAQVKR